MNLVLLTGGGTQSLLSIVVIYAVVIGIFWFFAIRPQKKQQKEQAGSSLHPPELADTVSYHHILIPALTYRFQFSVCHPEYMVRLFCHTLIVGDNDDRTTVLMRQFL